MLHGDGEMLLLYFTYGEERFCIAVMESDIADFDKLKGTLERDTYYDWETPYGYGGPLTDKPISEEAEKAFKAELIELCRERKVVSLFVRFHPLLENFKALPNVVETRYLRDTIAIDTSSLDTILSNMESGNRNKMRKAAKRGISIIKKPIDDYGEFLEMYKETMNKHDADEFYTFDESYFEYQKSFGDDAFFFYAVYEDTIIAGTLMYVTDKYMHYHLGGSRMEYRNLFSNNLLFYEASRYACEHGIKKLHLGGGMSADDSLFAFKKQFNKNGRHPFVVGRMIFDKNAYEHLLRIRKELDKDFDTENGFMIQYRR